jgi:hypothetical protein
LSAKRAGFEFFHVYLKKIYSPSKTHQMKKIFVLLSFCFSFFNQSFAAHIIGGEITYKFISQQGNTNTYEFTMNVYRDLFASNGTPLDDIARISVFQNNGSNQQLINNFGTSLLSVSELPRPVLPWLNVPFTTISGQLGVYKFSVDLPIIQSSYTIVYQRCCRNATINNIVNPSSVGATFSAEITSQAQVLKSSSPVFTNFAPVLVCANEPINLMQNATDADGDRLVYRLCNAYQGGSSAMPAPITASPPPYEAVPYLSGFSATQPVNGQPPLSIDSLTGRLIGRPSSIGQFLVSICVEKYRNNVLLGKIQRDIQLNIAACPGGPMNLATPTLVTPANNATLAAYNNIALDWTDVPSTGAYLLEVGKLENFGDAFQFVSNTSDFVLDNIKTRGFLQSNQQYFWRVRAFRTTEMLSDYSQTFGFKTGLLNESAEISFVSNFVVHPNPLSKNSDLNIQLDCLKRFDAQLELTDVAGKQIFSEKKHFNSGANKYTLHLNHTIPQGIYLLSISNQEGVLRKKIIVVD